MYSIYKYLRLNCFNASISQSVKMNGSIVVLYMLAAFEVTFGAVIHETPDRPNIITRSQWGAKAPKTAIENLKEDPPPYVIIHHSATDSCTTQVICQARTRNFQNYHMNEKGWSDIGYNFVVGEDGNVYEGRGWGKHGAHSQPYNSKSIGICLIGNFVGHEPHAAAVNATKKLIAYGVSTGKIQENYTLLGHRQIASTTCPGDKLYDLIKTWSHWSENA